VTDSAAPDLGRASRPSPARLAIDAGRGRVGLFKAPGWSSGVGRSRAAGASTAVQEMVGIAKPVSQIGQRDAAMDQVVGVVVQILAAGERQAAELGQGVGRVEVQPQAEHADGDPDLLPAPGR
jgi:hypothetical protein